MPDASLIRASPDSNDFCLVFSSRLRDSAVTAAASVGPSIAPSANAPASGMVGASQLRANPMASAETSTRPIASDRMLPRLRTNICLLILRDSSKSSGAMNSTRNSSGLVEMCRGSPTTDASSAPIMICTSGSASRVIN